MVEALEPREALIELVRHSYRVRLLQPLTPVSHFLRCASVVNQVAVCRLTFQRSLQELPSLVQLVEAHATNGTTGRTV